MIRTTAVPRPVRAGAAVASVLGIVALAGCASDAGTHAVESPSDAATGQVTSSAESDATADAEAAADSTYADGTYTAEGAYSTPDSVETITVTVTLADDVITDVEVSGDPQLAESRQYQSAFIGGIADAVVGKNIDEIAVSRVAGSSLTSGGFNAAIAQIKAEAES